MSQINVPTRWKNQILLEADTAMVKLQSKPNILFARRIKEQKGLSAKKGLTWAKERFDTIWNGFNQAPGDNFGLLRITQLVISLCQFAVPSIFFAYTVWTVG